MTGFGGGVGLVSQVLMQNSEGVHVSRDVAGADNAGMVASSGAGVVQGLTTKGRCHLA